MGIDPSGNFHEGKGTTGWCLLERGTTNIKDIGAISAKTSDKQEIHWDKHLRLIDQLCETHLMCLSMEDYLLYADESRSQVNSKFETPQLIGIIKLHAYRYNIPLLMRNAATVKKRWADHILVHLGYIEARGNHFYLPGSDKILSNHERDAIRHAVHADKYELKGDSK